MDPSSGLEGLNKQFTEGGGGNLEGILTYTSEHQKALQSKSEFCKYILAFQHDIAILVHTLEKCGLDL